MERKGSSGSMAHRLDYPNTTRALGLHIKKPRFEDDRQKTRLPKSSSGYHLYGKSPNFESARVFLHIVTVDFIGIFFPRYLGVVYSASMF